MYRSRIANILSAELSIYFPDLRAGSVFRAVRLQNPTDSFVTRFLGSWPTREWLLRGTSLGARGPPRAGRIGSSSRSISGAWDVFLTIMLRHWFAGQVGVPGAQKSIFRARRTGALSGSPLQVNSQMHVYVKYLCVPVTVRSLISRVPHAVRVCK
jgi:hypothetical protein